MGADDRLHQGVVDAWRSWDPWSSACWRHDLFPAPLVAQGERDVHRDGAAVLAQGGAAELTDFHGGRASHAASWCALAPRSSVQSEVSPSTRRQRSMPSGCRSTRSTSSSTMRACSAGNSSFHSGSNSNRAPRTSLSARPLSVLLAARQVWMMTSGVRISDRICSMTMRSISEDDGTDRFTYTVTDAFGNTQTSTITISIKDDVPTAHADTDAVDSGATTSGNVETGTGGSAGSVLAADTKGADGASVSYF